MEIKKIINNRNHKLKKKLILLGLFSLFMIGLFLFYNAINSWHLIGKMRVTRLIGLIIVAVDLSVATVIFQAVVKNKILSPTVMGFESMFSLVATASVFFLTSFVVNQIPRYLMFIIQATFMSILSVFLFTSIIGKRKNALHLMVLIGIVTGVFLRSLTQMMVSIMDPNEYLAVQDTNIASFAVIDKKSLLVTLVITIIVIILIYRKRYVFEIVNLGEELAKNLGLDYQLEIKKALFLSSILVASATALVGPLMFFGLLIANITTYFLSSMKMSYYIPSSAFMGIILLIGGQGILEHILNQATILPVVIEFVGGAWLLIMIVREARI